MDKISLLLPVDSKLILDDRQIPVTVLRLKKDKKNKNFNIKVFNHNEIVKTYEFSKMIIKIKEQEKTVVFDILDNKKEIIITGRKFLPSSDLKKYVKAILI